MAKRYHRLATAQTFASPDDGAPAQPIISLFETRHQAMPLRLSILEQHPLGSQAFVPLDSQPWLVVVAGGVEQPDLNDIHAFIASGDQGVNYAPGVWHHPLIALNHPSRFLVIDREGTGNNLNEFRLGPSIVVDWKTEEI
jgi:ureidoglycolate lyase